jgi:hypothetical protein
LAAEPLTASYKPLLLLLLLMVAAQVPRALKPLVLQEVVSLLVTNGR